jgi:group I intron endonuclease
MLGIYGLVNTIDRKIYVGSAIDLEQRRRNHFSELNRNVHYNVYLQRAVNKYGIENFEFKVLELVEEKTKLIEREQYWMDCYQSYKKEKGYNIRSKAESNLGVPHTKETIAKFQKLIPWNKGKKLSVAHIQKISQALQGHTLSIESRQKISYKNSGRVRSELVKTRISLKKKGSIPWNRGLTIIDPRVRKNIENRLKTIEMKRIA